jgi:hypothetical protein
MGTWGYGNFESDGALDILGMWIIKIIGQIRDGFNYGDKQSIHRHGEAQIVANVDILKTLCEKYKSYGDLEMDEVSKWKREYLDAFDYVTGNFKDPDDIEFAKKRREVIEETFDMFYNTLKEIIELYNSNFE